LRKDDGELTRTDQETVDLLSFYFKEVYTVEDVTTLPVVTEKDFDWKDSDLNFDETTVTEKLQKLNPDKSPGSDGIHPLLRAQGMCWCSGRAIIATFSAII